MTHSNFMERRDEIIRTLCKEFEDPKQDSFQAQQNARQAIDTLFLELIGEPQKWDVSKEDFGFRDQGKNELRKQLRTIIQGDKS